MIASARAFLHSAVDGFMDAQAKQMAADPESYAGCDDDDFNQWFVERY